MRLSVTTPQGSVVDTDIEEVTVPGALGELGILPGHVALMTALKPGVLIYRRKDHAATLAVGEGFLQVAPASGVPGAADRVIVLVDKALPVASVNREAAEQDLARAETELGAWKRDLDAEYQVLVVRRDWALARIDATKRAGGASH